MEGNRKQNEGEGTKRPSSGIPKIPKTGLTFDGQDKSTYDSATICRLRQSVIYVSSVLALFHRKFDKIFCKRYAPELGFKSSMKNVGLNIVETTPTYSLPLYLIWRLPAYLSQKD